MANRTRDNEELKRAASRSSDLLNARNANRRDARPYARGDYEELGSSPRRGARHAAHAPQRSSNQGGSLVGFFKRNSVYILSVAAVVIIAVLMIAFIRACAPSSSASQEAEEPSYDWNNLDRTNGRYAYVENGQVKSRLGIDVSENQFWIDWDAVAADGIDFAIVRVGYRGTTEGDLYLDEYYEANVEGAKAAGLDCGVYFFSQARTVDEALEEAEFTLEQLKGVDLEYGVTFDSEQLSFGDQAPRTAGLSQDEMTDIAEAFCKRIEQAGYKTMIYGNVYDLSCYSYERMKDRNLWWAEYGTIEPSTDVNFEVWQYANDGIVAGVDTVVDMNIDMSGVFGPNLHTA